MFLSSEVPIIHRAKGSCFVPEPVAFAIYI